MHTAKIRCALVFKGHSLGGSSIASLQQAIRWALPRFVVFSCNSDGHLRQLYHKLHLKKVHTM